MNPTSIELAGTIIFAFAVIHTFCVKKFNELAHKFPEGSIGENTFHFLGEVEVVFGIWGALFIAIYSYLKGFMNLDASHNLILGVNRVD